MTRSFIALTVILALFAGCGGKKTTNYQGTELPDFVLNPPKEDGYIFGVGISEQQSPQLAMETADVRAKREVARVLSLKVKSMLSDALSQAAVGSEAEATEFVESVSRAITETDVSGCTIEKREVKGGKMYSLAKYPIDESAREFVKGVIKTHKPSAKSEYDREIGEKALQALDEHLQ